MNKALSRIVTAFAFVAIAVAPQVVWPQVGLARQGLAHQSIVQAEFHDVNGTLALRGLSSTPRVIQRATSDARPAAACDKLTASTPATWFATDNDGGMDTTTEVDNYAKGSTVIAPGFKYDCAPRDIDVVVIIYNQVYGTEPALVEKRTLQASTTAGVFAYALTTPDGSPLQEGNWRVAFYQDKTPLSTGEILLGGKADVDVTTQAVLQGTVADLRSGQPVVGARVYVLNPGVSIADFTHDAKREDIFVQTRSDDQGQFALWKPLERNTQYAMLIAADGYKLRGTDRLIIGDQAPSPVTLDIKVVKR